MPRYTTRRKKRTKRDKKRIEKTLPRDRRKLLRWAVRQGPDSYDWIRRTTRHLLETADVPAYIDKDALESIAAQHGEGAARPGLGRLRRALVQLPESGHGPGPSQPGQDRAEPVGRLGHPRHHGRALRVLKANPKGLNPLPSRPT